MVVTSLTPLHRSPSRPRVGLEVKRIFDHEWDALELKVRGALKATVHGPWAHPAIKAPSSLNAAFTFVPSCIKKVVCLLSNDGTSALMTFVAHDCIFGVMKSTNENFLSTTCSTNCACEYMSLLHNWNVHCLSMNWI